MTASAISALARHGVTSLPELAFVLGTGLGPLADEAENAIAIPYVEIPGFPVSGVVGHKGRLVIGDIEARAQLSAVTNASPAVTAAARDAISAIERLQQMWSVGQSIFYGLSLGSVLLLAAAGLAISTV